MQKILCVVAVTFAGCGLIPYDVDQDIPEQTVSGNVAAAALGQLFPTAIPLTINIKDEEAKHDTTLIHSATLSRLTFSATPHGAPVGNFDFLDELHVKIAATGASTPAAVEIANSAPVPKGTTVLNLNIIPNIDLLPYINAGAEITATATGHAPAQDFHFDGHITITLHI